MPTNAKPLAHYIRVSRLGGRKREGYISPAVQADRAAAVTERFGFTIAETFSDEDYSGGNMDRPAFIELVAAVRDGKYGGLVVATLDRFSRDVTDALMMIRELHSYGGVLVCDDMDSPVTPDMTDTDLLILLVRLWQAQSERDRKKGAFAAAITKSIRDGRALRAPYGYRKKVNSKGARKSTALEPDPATAPAVVLVFDLRGEGWSWARIVEALSTRFPLTDADGQPVRWTHSRVARIVDNEVYIGIARWGDIREPDAHPSLVTREQWDKARASRGAKFKTKNHDGQPLAGLVRCAGCSRVMSSTTVTRKGVRRRYYRCPSFQTPRLKSCTAPVLVTGEALDAAITEWFIGQFAERVVTGVSVDDTMATFDAAYDAASDHLAYVMDMAESAADADERAMWAPKLDAARTARTAARDERDEHRAKLRGFKVTGDLDADAIRALPVPELRALLSQGIEALFIRRATGWREDVSSRVVGIFSPGQTPTANLPGRRTGTRSASAAAVPFVYGEPNGSGVVAA